MKPIELGYNYSFSINDENTKIVIYESYPKSFTRVFHLPIECLDNLIKELKEKGIVD